MKTLIFGPANAGKTSLMRTTCQGYSFMRMLDIPPTRGISRENYLFRGLMELTLWDAGGQEKYIEKYFSDTQKAVIFSEVEIPIFMVDATVFDAGQRVLLEQFLENITEFSPETEKIYILLNKIDLPTADPDKVYNLLSKDLKPAYKSLCVFTPVSVKEGSAQYRLIEILDNSLQKSVLDLEKLQSMRNILDEIKKRLKCDVFIFNRPDGLITTSTMGQFKSNPLNFLSLDMGSLESNIDIIFAAIQNRSGKASEPLFLSTLIYEAENHYVILYELNDFTVLMVITPEKTFKFLEMVMKFLDKNNPDLIAVESMIRRR